MDYIRLDNSHVTWPPEPHRFDEVHWNETNPYMPPTAEDGLDGKAWLAWFHAVEATDPAQLKTKVPQGFHDLLDGNVPCPTCGAPLHFEPGRDRWHMRETCQECGYACDVEDQEYGDLCEKRYRWFREHHLPTRLSEYWMWQSIEEHQQAMREGREIPVVDLSASSMDELPERGHMVVLAAGLKVDYETGTVYPATMSREEAIARTNY